MPFSPEVELVNLEAALCFIAVGMRPDGTWNRDRLACQQLAVSVLSKLEQSRKNNGFEEYWSSLPQDKENSPVNTRVAYYSAKDAWVAALEVFCPSSHLPPFHLDKPPLTSEIHRLTQALQVISTFPTLEQDNMLSAGMRKIAKDALA